MSPLCHALIKVNFGANASIEVPPLGFTNITNRNLSEIDTSHLSINNSALSLWVYSFTGNNTIRFEQSSTDVFRSLYDFDIRYYQGYSGSLLTHGGLYVFKTDDSDSRPFPHKLESILVYRGNLS